MSTRWKDYYESAEVVEELMEAADRAATSNREREFIDTLYEQFEEYGMRAFLSSYQHDWFVKIANK